MTTTPLPTNLQSPIIPAMEKTATKCLNPVAIWLFACCFFIFSMVAIGGVTRLTGSGLSITQWKPVSGIIPPFTETHWQEEFAHYQLSPEYLKKNIGMSLEEFKGIFWLEFIHRLVGRLTGFVFLLPFIYFLATKQISGKLALRLGGIFALGGLQGVVGWFMVKSGLQSDPHVSPLWLAFHLCMALTIYGLVLNMGYGLWTMSKGKEYAAAPPLTPSSLALFSSFLIATAFLQIFLGALVAGMHAGLMYNTFPLMDGQFAPSGMFIMNPWYINFFENATTVQFTHRMGAYLLTMLIIIFWAYSRKFSLTNKLKRAIALLPIAVAVQFSLGVLTLLHQVPVALASLHQVFAVVLFSLVIYIRKELELRAKG